MPEGPLGGPRPLANDKLMGFAVFTNPVISGKRVTIPNWFREQRDMGKGDVISGFVFPLKRGILNTSSSREIKAKVTGRNRITLPRSVVSELRLVEGDGVLVAIDEVDDA